MNLGFDIDGVIADFVNIFSDLAKKKYGVTLTEVDIYCHDLNLVLGVPKDEVVQLITETLKTDLPLYPEAKETLEKLFSEGHRIYLLTARYDFLFQNTLLWLKEKSIPYTDILNLTEGKKYQANIDIDVIVEDCLCDALEWTKRVKNVLIFDHPWNQTNNVKNLLKRVYSWAEIYEEIKKMQPIGLKVQSKNEQ